MRNPFFDSLSKATRTFTLLSLMFLLFLFLLSIYEILVNGLTHGFLQNSATIFAANIVEGISFWLKANVWLFLLFLFFYFISQRAAYIFFYTLSTLLLLIHIGLIQYFNKALVPLGADFFSYSIADMKQTIGASGGIRLGMLLAFVLFLAAWVYVLYKLSRKNNLQFKGAVFLPLAAVAFMLSGYRPASHLFSFSTEYTRNLVQQKTDFFISQAYTYFFPPRIEEDIYADSYSGDYGLAEASIREFSYVHETEFPFLHTDETPDVLSPFFHKSKQRPNIVILLVEGLGRAFTNEGAYLGSFTPFLDSLAKQSLYWKNFLSQGGRTFAVLPSVLGSLPFARNGFNELGEKMPSHLSLLSLAKFNGYQTAFFYGGNSRFDNMQVFLKKNAIDEIHDEPTFPRGYTRMPSRNNFSWGYGDRELFRRYFEVQKEDTAQPKLSVVLTVSTHSPFLINDQKKYEQEFEARMQQLNFPEEKKKEYRNYKNQYASILYCDDAIRNFMETYRQRKDFANTIFLITGDHRMPEIPLSTKIDRFHVPFLIYSPLLTRTAEFASISSHFDIAPSLLSFLQNNYAFQKPALAAWMGSGLDTSRSFGNHHLYPLMQTKNEVSDFVLGQYHLNGNLLFSVSDNLEENILQDSEKYSQLQAAFTQFKKRNEQLISGARLLPDSIYQKYFPH